MTNINRRVYTELTKADAVGQVLRAWLPLLQVAKSYDMPEQTLSNWVRKARLDKRGLVSGVSAGAGSGVAKPSASEQEAEMSKLRAQVNRLTMERDILKKAAAYFAKDSL